MDKTNTRKLIARRTQVVARGVGMFTGESSAASGRGAVLTDVDGNELIDLAAGIGVGSAGHCDPRVVAAISEQAGRLLHSCIHVATYEPYVALCEKLTQLLPHGEKTKAMLVNSGAEAVENAIKIARQAEYRWLGRAWHQSFRRFTEGAAEIVYVNDPESSAEAADPTRAGSW